MRRRRFRRPVQPEFEHRLNERIRARTIRVVDDEGNMLGVMTPDRGRLIARGRGLDLVEVAPEARPPVCRVMDYGKYRYARAQREKASKKRATALKVVQLRPKTDTHDLETKMKRVRRFIERGDRVRLVMRLRGRERGVTDRWVRMLRGLVADLGDAVKVVSAPRAEGRTLSMTLEPAAA